MFMKTKVLPIKEKAEEAGILSAKEIEFTPDRKIIYLTVSFEDEDPDFMKTETKKFWLLYKYSHPKNESTKENTQKDPQTI